MSAYATFRYPGQGPRDGAYAGALMPEVEMDFELDAQGSGDGSPFRGARRVFHRLRRVWSLRWPTLSRLEVDFIFDQLRAAAFGGVPVLWVPDDGQDPVLVRFDRRRQLIRRTRAAYTAELGLREER